MAGIDALLEKLKACRGPFPYKELVTLLSALGYVQKKPGKTGGSRRKFYNAATGALVTFHAPHGKDVKPYVARDVREHLQSRGLL